MTHTKRLFEPVEKYGQHFKNRIAMAPMTRSRAIGNNVNELIATYYTQRVGAGLIITEGNSPSADGIGYSRTPGIYSKEQITAWKLVTDAVHQAGGKIFTQLMHSGRVGHKANKPEGARLVGPSAITAQGDIWTDANGLQPTDFPEAMTLSDVKSAISDFASASSNAIAAGFDGIEFHGANGYLIEQFLNPHSNHRNDEYGGSVTNRVRFLLDAVDAAIVAIGKEKIGARLSPYGTYNDMPEYKEVFETYSLIASELSKRDILYIHIVDFQARTTEEGKELLRFFRKNFNNILILNGGYDGARAATTIEEEGADMISFGSSFVSNPDLPLRIKNNIRLTAPNTDLFFTADATGFTDYAVADLAVSRKHSPA